MAQKNIKKWQESIIFCRGLIYQAQTERRRWLAWCCGLRWMGSHEAKLKGGGGVRSRAGVRGGEDMKHNFLNNDK